MSADDDKRELEMAIMSAQLEKLNLELERLRQDLKWEPWKALAAIVAGTAAMGGAIVALAAWMSQHINQLPALPK